MARPHPDHTRFVGFEGPEIEQESVCCVPRCTNTAAHEHHAWFRTHIRKKGGGGWDWIIDNQTGDVIRNVLPLCFGHHDDLHEARARLYYDPFIKWFYWKKLKQTPDRVPDDAPLKYGPSVLLPDHHATQTPPDVPVVVVGEQRSSLRDAPGGAALQPVTAGAAPHIHPGEKCPTCERKMPHPKKPTSPTSKTKAYRLPVDEETGHAEVYAAAAEYVGAAGKPFEQFKVYTIALAALLQDEGWRGFYDREAAA